MSKKPKKVLPPSERACIYMLKKEIDRSKEMDLPEATDFLLESGFPEFSLEQIIGCQEGVGDNERLLECMKVMSLDELYVLINNVRERRLIAELQKVFPISRLMREAIEPAPDREKARDFLDVLYPGLGQKSEVFYQALCKTIQQLTTLVQESILALNAANQSLNKKIASHVKIGKDLQEIEDAKDLEVCKSLNDKEVSDEDRATIAQLQKLNDSLSENSKAPKITLGEAYKEVVASKEAVVFCEKNRVACVEAVKMFDSGVKKQRIHETWMRTCDAHIPKEAEKRVLALSERGRACLHLLKKEIDQSKEVDLPEATHFLLRCGFSERSLKRIICFQEDVENNAQLLKGMKTMSLEGLFLLINNAREACLMAEQKHFMTLPVGLVKEVLESTLSIMPGVTAIGRGRWENDDANKVDPHEICLTSIVGVFGAHGPSKAYFESLDPKSLAMLYQDILVDRLTHMLKVQAALCPADTVIALAMPGAGAGAFSGRKRVGTLDRFDFVKRQLDLSLQRALDNLTDDEKAKYAGVRLDVFNTRHPEYGKPIARKKNSVLYKAVQSENNSQIATIPKAPQHLFSDVEKGNHIIKGIEGRAVLVVVTAADWMAKELCEGRGNFIVGNGNRAGSVDHAIGVSTNGMDRFDNTGGEKYSREQDRKAAYAVKGNVVLLNINEPVSDKVRLSVAAQQEQLRHCLIDMLAKGAIESGPYREAMQNLLEVRYPDLKEKLNIYRQKILGLPQFKNEVMNKALLPVTAAAEELTEAKEWLATKEEKEALFQDSRSSASEVVDEMGARSHKLKTIDILKDLVKNNEEACQAAAKKAEVDQSNIDNLVQERKQEIQIEWISECDVCIQSIDPRNRVDLMQGAITPGPHREVMRFRLDSLYTGLGEKSDKIHAAMQAVQINREEAENALSKGDAPELKQAEAALNKANNLLSEKKEILEKAETQSDKSNINLAVLKSDVEVADQMLTGCQQLYGELIKKVSKSTDSSEEACRRLWKQTCEEHIARIESKNSSGGQKTHRRVTTVERLATFQQAAIAAQFKEQQTNSQQQP